MRFPSNTSQAIVLSIALALLSSSLLGCGQRRNAKLAASAPVKASFVLSKLRYGFAKEAEREIWCFEWDNQSWVDYPELYGSIKQYRTVAWAREAVGGDRIFQTYDLISNHMDRAPVALYTGTEKTYQGNGWRPQMPEDGLTIRANGTGLKSGDLEVRLDGAWKRVSESYARDMTSADGPSLIPGKYTFDAFFGDVVIIMSGQEILRQRVEGVTAEVLNGKCQGFPGHELFVYLDGLPDRPGTAWFLDLTLGHPRPIQGSDAIFPGRVNTLPSFRNGDVYHPSSLNPVDIYTERLAIGEHYLYRASFNDPDLDFGDAITKYEWVFNNGRVVVTKKPECSFSINCAGDTTLKLRAFDRSGKTAPWAEFTIPTEGVVIRYKQ